jgi:hypothetical protein
MIVKALTALALVSAPASVAPAVTYDDQRTNTQYPLVKLVVCDKGRGTAFRIGPRRFLSVAHVTSNEGCTIEGQPITVIENDGARDFSIIEAGLPKGGAEQIDCRGFVKSKWYWSVGYAWGLPYQTTVALYSTAFTDDAGKQIFIGKHTVIPGMSGGKVVDPETGAVVGVINSYHPLFGLSFSRALKDTSVCRSALGRDGASPMN